MHLTGQPQVPSLYLRKRILPYPFNRRPSGPQKCSRLCKVQKRKAFVHAKSRTPNRPVHSPVTIIITLYQLVAALHNYVRISYRYNKYATSIYTASAFVPCCLKNVTVSTGRETRPVAFQAWRWVKSSNT
jgi:hypothetical protein